MSDKVVVVMAGPNGAGKTTTAGVVLPDLLSIVEFVNADEIAREIAADDPEAASIAAGRQMLEQMRSLSAQEKSFAFETTLASRSFAPMLRELKTRGYRIHLLFVWLPDPEMCVRRVADRVARGGHHIPAETIHRRYWRGLSNFFKLYRPIVDTWRFIDNSQRPIRLIAEKRADGVETIADPQLWSTIQAEVNRQ